MKKCECGEGIPEGSKVFHHPEIGYLGPCCASEQDAESVLLAGEDTDEDDTDEDDDSDDDWDDEDDEDEEEPGTPPGTVRIWIDGEDFDEEEVRRWDSQRKAAPGTLGCREAARILREHLEEVYESDDKTYWAKGDVQIYLDGRWQDDREVRVAIHPEEPKCPREAWGLSDDDSAHRWRAPHSIVGGCESNPGVQGHGGGVVMEEVCTLCGCARITDTWAQDPDGGEQGLTSISYEADKYEDEIMRTLVVTLRPDDADEDEDEDADEDEDEDEDADEDADEDEDEDGTYEEAKYALTRALREYDWIEGSWEQDPHEPDVVRVLVPMGLRKTLQDKLLKLACVEDCAEA